MKRNIFVRIDKTDNVISTYTHYLNTSDIVSGKSITFWKEVVDFEKEQGKVKIQARTLLFELPLEWQLLPSKQLKKRCGKLIRKLLHNCIGYTFFIRTATNNDNNFHMIVLFSERMLAEAFVYEKRDQYRCSITGKIVGKDFSTAVKIISKGDIKKGADGKAVINTAAFGVKNAKYKTKEWLYTVKSITLKHFRLYNASYVKEKLVKFSQVRYSNLTASAKKLIRSVNYRMIQLDNYIKLNPKSKKAKILELKVFDYISKKELKDMIKYVDYHLKKREVF